jgi:hypothetical protein
MAPPTFKKLAKSCDNLFKGFDSHTEISGTAKTGDAFPKQGGVSLDATAAFDKKGKDSMSFEYTTSIAPSIEVTGKWETERAVNQSATVSLEHTVTYSGKSGCCNGYSVDVTHEFGEQSATVAADYVTDGLNFTTELPVGAGAKGVTATAAFDTGVAGLLAGAKVASKDFTKFGTEVGLSYAIDKNTSLALGYNVDKGSTAAKVYYKAHSSLAFGLKADLDRGFSATGASAAFDYKLGKNNLKFSTDLFKKSANVAYKVGGKYTFTAAAASMAAPSHLVCGLQVDLS